MTLRKLVGIAFLVLAGCQWIPGTDQHSISKAEKLAADSILDPSSAQFRNVQVGLADHVCGEINGKNRQGGYAGFLRFIVNTTSGSVSIEPFVPWSDAAMGNAARRCARAEAISTRSSSDQDMVEMSCADAKVIGEELDKGAKFDDEWARFCMSRAR